MKSKILFIILIILMGISIYFTYQRSFVWKNFDVVNSDEESMEEEAIPEEGSEATPEEEELLESATSTATTTGSAE